MLRVGVISYLPNQDNRGKRKTLVHKTLADIRTIVPYNIPITIIAQNYDEGDEYVADGITYIHHREGIGQSAARNQLLEDFYNSDDDFLLYMDDDTSFYNRYNVIGLFEALHNHPDWFNQVDVFTGIEGRFTPFTEANAKLDLEQQWVFKAMPVSTAGELRCIRNLKKYYGETAYYKQGIHLGDNTIFNFGEDLYFRLEYSTKYNFFMCRNLILNNRGMATYTSAIVDLSKVEQQDLYTDITQQIYGLFNIGKTKGGDWDTRKYKTRIPYYSVTTSGVNSNTPGLSVKKLF